MSSTIRRSAPLLVLLALTAACASRLPPGLRAPQPVSGAIVLLRPVASLGPDVSPDRVQELGGLLGQELAARLAEGGIRVASVPEDAVREIRERLVRAAPGLVARSPARARGAEAIAEAALAPARAAGARVVVLPLLGREGPVPDERGFLPRRDDELVPVNEERRSWVAETISRPGLPTPGLALRLLLVDAETGRVLAIRKVTEPAAAPSSWGSAVVALARLASRELVPTAGEGSR